MNKLILLGLLLIVPLLLLSGCPQPPVDELPEDFSLRYGTGAMHLEWGAYYFDIDSSGQATFKKTMEMHMEKIYTFTVTEEERLQIYNAARTNGFFSLLDTYQDPNIMDGGWDEISITADGSTKTVTLLNYALPQFDLVDSAIFSVLKNYIEDPFPIDDFFEDCNHMKTICEGKEFIECETEQVDCLGNEFVHCGEWQYFCGWDLNELTPEYCDALVHREECTEFCRDNTCSEELCEALIFEADACQECSPGCCSLCNDLDTCADRYFCKIVWIHPEGESWQFSACDNKNFCMGDEAACHYFSLSYQGYRYHSLIEEDANKAAEYSEIADALQDTYNEVCE